MFRQLVLLSLLALASGKPLSNPCEISDVVYQMPYPYNAMKYIECEPAGSFEVKRCPVGTFFNSFNVMFSTDKLICTNFTRIEETKLLTSSCENDGIYRHIIYGVFMCICDSTRYIGDHCEQERLITGPFDPMTIFPLNNMTTYEEIRNNKFDIKAFIAHWPIDIIPRKNKTTADNTTDPQLSKYISKYDSLVNNQSLFFDKNENSTIRFDEIISLLIPYIVDVVYTESQKFNASLEIIKTLPANKTATLNSLIPILLAYSKTAIVHNDNIFVRIHTVLEMLAMNLLKMWPEVRQLSEAWSKIRQHILSQTDPEFTNGLEGFEQTGVLSNPLGLIDFTASMYNERRKMNKALAKSYVAFNNFDFLAAKNINSHGGFNVEWMSKDFAQDNLAIELLQDITNNVQNIHDRLTSYAELYLINFLAYA